jgi:hypothetical protein
MTVGLIFKITDGDYFCGIELYTNGEFRLG